MTGVILAGGSNRRYPLLKGLIELKGKRLIERVRDSLREFKDLAIITNRPEVYFYLGIPLYGDTVDFRCPLTGIHTALSALGDDVFICGCDMPFIRHELVRAIKEEALIKLTTFDAIIPLRDGRPQPLLGVYSKRLSNKIKEWLDTRRCNMTEFLKEINTLYLEESFVRNFDPEGLSFININTPEDKEKADLYLATGKVSP